MVDENLAMREGPELLSEGSVVTACPTFSLAI